MLRLRGRPSTLFYGGRNDAAEGLSAHVWVKVEGWSVVGGDGSGFALLAAFPLPDPQERRAA
jgi:hypothetical protein